MDFDQVPRDPGSAAEVLYTTSAAKSRPWIDDWCHRLRHEIGAAAALIADLGRRGEAAGRKRLPAVVEAALSSLRNRVKGGRMNEAGLVERQLPIASGVTEAAGQALVKPRRCGAARRWQEGGAAAVLSRRCLTYTSERWAQFGGRIDRIGFPVAA